MDRELNRKAMEQMVRGLQTKSDKIRKLRSEKFTRGDIARFLGVRPQFVRNVEVYDQHRREAGKNPAEGNLRATEGATTKVRLAPDGQFTIPASLCQALGLKEGDTLWVSLEDGEIRLANAEAITRRVQTITRKFVPAGVSLVDELLAERRRETERELRGE